jgi:hypothetical protein
MAAENFTAGEEYMLKKVILGWNKPNTKKILLRISSNTCIQKYNPTEVA